MSSQRYQEFIAERAQLLESYNWSCSNHFFTYVEIL